MALCQHGLLRVAVLILFSGGDTGSLQLCGELAACCDLLLQGTTQVFLHIWGYIALVHMCIA